MSCKTQCVIFWLWMYSDLQSKKLHFVQILFVFNGESQFFCENTWRQNYIKLLAKYVTDRSIPNYSSWSNIFQSVIWCNMHYIEICCCVILPFKYNTKLAKISYSTPIIFIFLLIIFSSNPYLHSYATHPLDFCWLKHF